MHDKLAFSLHQLATQSFSHRKEQTSVFQAAEPKPFVCRAPGERGEHKAAGEEVVKEDC